VPQGQTLAQFALRWILLQQAVTCAIPGGRRRAQVEENMSAADLPALPEPTVRAVERVYERHAKQQVHQRW
jgi:aryl-alcohol dehydrogenase-like predicted oxidoreductase